MQSPSSDTLSAKYDGLAELWRWQVPRLQFRAALVWEGIKACLFWVVLLAIGVRLSASGFQWATAGLFLLWFFFAIPTLAIQCAIFADLFNYIFTKRVYLLRTFERSRAETTESADTALARIRLSNPGLYHYLRIAIAAANTSPLTPLAMWAMLVLLRLPSKAHTPGNEPTSMLEFPNRLRDAETFLVERLVRRREMRS